MVGPDPAVAVVRVAVRRALAEHGLQTDHLLVAVSGGADSLALAAAAGFVAPRLGGRVGAVVVDHQLQDGSARVAQRAAAQCRDLGLDPVQVVTVTVPTTADGPEAAARDARMQALAQAAEQRQAGAVLLGHTRDDQAEQVLLGLARGSGSRSLAGMAPARPLTAGSPVLLLRPLLDQPRSITQAACRALALQPWQDPHNSDERFARVRARRALAELDRTLGPGVPAALARTASLLRDDAQVLDEVTDTAYARLGDPPWAAPDLAGVPASVRRRLWQRLAIEAGSPSGAVTGAHLRAVDDLVRDWHGQGPVDLPGGVRAGRSQGRVWLERRGDS